MCMDSTILAFRATNNSEVLAPQCLQKENEKLKERLGTIVIERDMLLHDLARSINLLREMGYEALVFGYPYFVG